MLFPLDCSWKNMKSDYAMPYVIINIIAVNVVIVVFIKQML